MQSSLSSLSPMQWDSSLLPSSSMLYEQDLGEVRYNLLGWRPSYISSWHLQLAKTLKSGYIFIVCTHHIPLSLWHSSWVTAWLQIWHKDARNNARLLRLGDAVGPMSRYTFRTAPRTPSTHNANYVACCNCNCYGYKKLLFLKPLLPIDDVLDCFQSWVCCLVVLTPRARIISIVDRALGQTASRQNAPFQAVKQPKQFVNMLHAFK